MIEMEQSRMRRKYDRYVKRSVRGFNSHKKMENNAIIVVCIILDCVTPLFGI